MLNNSRGQITHTSCWNWDIKKNLDVEEDVEEVSPEGSDRNTVIWTSSRIKEVQFPSATRTYQETEVWGRGNL